MSSNILNDVLAAFDAQAGGTHAGFRPVHARGVMLAGTFTPSPTATDLTRAPHANRASTPVTVRFSTDSGVPTAPENDPAKAAPMGMAVRFHLADHVHTDIIGISHDGFPTRTGEEFFELMQAVAASGPEAPSPPPIVAFLASHPAAKRFVEAAKPLPVSYAQQPYFAVTAFKFINAAGASRFGRFRLRPAAATAHLTAEQAAEMPADFLTAEITERVRNGPVVFRVTVQLAEGGDEVADATVSWPAERTEAEFGTLTLTSRVDETAVENWKVIFDPLPRVDGIDTAGDPLTAFRADLYLLSGRRRRAAGRG